MRSVEAVPMKDRVLRTKRMYSQALIMHTWERIVDRIETAQKWILGLSYFPEVVEMTSLRLVSLSLSLNRRNTLKPPRERLE